MKKTITLIKRAIILAIAIPIVLLGLILIPLPGPGLLVCFLGFFILSLEFEWARTRFDKAKQELKEIFEKTRARGEQITQRKR